MALLRATYTAELSSGLQDYLLGVGSLANGVSSNRTSRSFSVQVETHYTLAVTGSGFSYAGDGVPSRGVINSITATIDGRPVFEMTGMAVDAASVRAWLITGDGSAESPLFQGNDTITGGSRADIISGGAGHDVMMGGSHQDTLVGGSGNDHLYGQSPSGGDDMADSLDGGNGSDYIQGNAGNDRITGGGGSDRVQGGADNDLIEGDGAIGFSGRDADGNDTINGNLGNDSIAGNNGNDQLRGGQGNDLIFGDDGNDVLFGDKGNDVLSGGRGHDVLTGGEGRDTFMVQTSDDLSRFYGAYGAGPVSDPYSSAGPGGAYDIVTDFTIGVDRVNAGNSRFRDHYLAGSAVDLPSAFTLAMQLLRDTPQPYYTDYNVAAISVGADCFIFSIVDSTPTTIKLLGVSAFELRDRTNGITQTGGSGNDTLIAGQYQDLMSGEGGADRFIFPQGSSAPLDAAPLAHSFDGRPLDGAPYDIDTIKFFDHLVDKIYLPGGIGSRPEEILRPAPFGSIDGYFSDAMRGAQALLDASPGTREVAVVNYGNSTYLFYNDSGGTQINSIVRLLTSSPIDSGDFLGNI